MTRTDLQDILQLYKKSKRHPTAFARLLHEAVGTLLLEVDGLTRGLNRATHMKQRSGLERQYADPLPNQSLAE